MCATRALVELSRLADVADVLSTSPAPTLRLVGPDNRLPGAGPQGPQAHVVAWTGHQARP